ncbi:MAG TPA: T9SS type A sorting domain-containing protein, partial [Bacteroidales bacterium]|nr:T9SS type A sorting domain-containing protein [Bacteroidales bacterium]
IIEENVVSSLIIYPNPVTNELIIEAKDNHNPINFQIINTIGQVIYNGELINEIVIPTTNFVSGIYLVKLENGKTFEFKKIVKQ